MTIKKQVKQIEVEIEASRCGCDQVTMERVFARAPPYVERP